MNKFLTFLIFILQTSLYSQTIIDSLKFPGESMGIAGSIEIDDTIYSHTFYNTTNTAFILRFDQQLNLIDTISTDQTGRTNCGFQYFFKYRGDNYITVNSRNVLDLSFSAHKIENGRLTDSIGIDLDTITLSTPRPILHVDSNTIRAIIYRFYTGSSYPESAIVDLDSNFRLKKHYYVDFTLPGPYLPSEKIVSLNCIHDSIWHIYTKNALYIYNPITQTTTDAIRLHGEIHDHFPLGNGTYLALGISSRLTNPGQPTSVWSALGFYRVNTSGNILDTVAFSLDTDSSQAPYSYEFSDERAKVSNAIVYDTSNIILVSESLIHNSQLQQIDHFFVIKTDVHGNKQWQYKWGGIYKITSLRSVTPTPDKGCLITGFYAYEYPKSINNAGILIKLGPNGNISNVELDAPETVVSFYPNPVKDKLHYSFLPEANGAYFLEIIDMQGKPVLEKVLENEKGFVPVNLQSGFYLYHLKDSAGKVQQVGKIMVE